MNTWQAILLGLICVLNGFGLGLLACALHTKEPKEQGK